MAGAAEGDAIPLSALQHYLYCPRQCALIHVEREWVENEATAQGRILHARVDDPKAEKRRGVRTLSALPIRSERLGVAGIADLVELRDGPEGPVPFPIEVKRGRPKPHRADEVQLCAQALCLEEMFGASVPEGALFYGQTKRRRPVAFDAALRALTEQAAADAAALLRRETLPPPDYAKRKCGGCSLAPVCAPLLDRSRSARRYLDREIGS